MKYDGIRCPVCKQAFDAGSDVVVCPECGTPHHRECWSDNGGCMNEAKHGTGFGWENPRKAVHAKETEKLKRSESGAGQETPGGTSEKETPKEKSEKLPLVIPALGKGSKEDTPENGVIGEISIDPDGTPRPEFREVRGDERIGKYTVADYAKVIGKNVPKFIPKFMMMDRENRRVSWNWAAFIFGPFYLAYRKLYKPALLALLCMFFLPLVFLNEVTEYYRSTYDVYETALTQEAYETTEQMQEAASKLSASLPEPPFALTASSYVEFFVDILCGLYANYLCKRKCEKVLDTAKDKNLEGNVRDEFLQKKGGRTVGGIVLVILGFYLFAIVVGVIYSFAGTDLGTLLRKLIK